MAIRQKLPFIMYPGPQTNWNASGRFSFVWFRRRRRPRNAEQIEVFVGRPFLETSVSRMERGGALREFAGKEAPYIAKNGSNFHLNAMPEGQQRASAYYTGRPERKTQKSGFFFSRAEILGGFCSGQRDFSATRQKKYSHFFC